MQKNESIGIDFSSRFGSAAVMSSLFLNSPPEVSREITSRIIEERKFPFGKEKIVEVVNFARKLQGLEECFM